MADHAKNGMTTSDSLYGGAVEHDPYDVLVQQAEAKCGEADDLDAICAFIRDTATDKKLTTAMVDARLKDIVAVLPEIVAKARR